MSHPDAERTPTAMYETTLTRYENQDGERQVALHVHEGSARPFWLADLPAAGFGVIGTHSMLGSHATRAEADEAAARHTAICVREGTYEAWGAHLLALELES